MNPSWLSYVPYNIAHDVLTHPGVNPVGREQHAQTVALFADVSGFTAISEALGQAGRAGTEELTQILNAYFETMIDLIQSYGGIVGQFGGDALTVLFPYAAATRDATARRAIQCALEMQVNMDRYQSIDTRAGNFQLTMKAGLADGSFYATTVGNRAAGLKVIIAGPVLDLCADAEHHAGQGEIVIHDNLLPLAGDIEIAAQRDGFSVVTGLAAQVAPQPLDTIDRELTADERALFAAYLHPIIAQRQTRGQRRFINEHRKVTVLFVNFQGFDYDHDPEVGAKLQAYFLAVLRTVQRYDGYLNKVDMGDKGSKYIVLFGAPVAHEDDEVRALRCALELRTLPNATVTIGANTGFAFCGLVGSPARQEYTVMGDAVNLAARMMQAADPQQILVSKFTHRHAAPGFDWGALPPVKVKGKRDPIQVYAVQHIRGRSIVQTQELDYTLPMVGREDERRLIADKLDQVLQNRGQIIGITAEAGMGKTRLAADVIRMAADRGLSRAGGECESYGTSTSYLVWHHVWRTLFALDPTWSLQQQIAHLEAQVAAVDPDFVRRVPLLGAALNLPIPDNALTRALEAKVRKASLESLLVAYLRYRAQVTPLLLVLEDCHWMDPVSYDLLETVARNIDDVPVLLLMLYRPPELAHMDLARLDQFAHFSELALTEFAPDEAELLIKLKMQHLFGAIYDIPPELIDTVTAKAQGNPFYIDEMINLLHDQDIDPQDTNALQQLELPDSLHSLIISRIDRLVEDQKITLKVASVIGRLFHVGWLQHVYPEAGQADRVQEQLDALRQQDFVLPSGTPDPEFEYLFKHIVTQEVAYESLAVATRANLHEQIAAYIEDTYTDTLDQYLDLLAFHYGHSENYDKQRAYFDKAGQAAQATYANDAAVAYYQQLLPLLPEPEHPDVLLRLGKVWELTGKWDEAAATYRDALRLAEDAYTQALSRNELGRLLFFQGNYAASLDELTEARELFESLDDQQGICKALINMGNVHLYQGNFSQALGLFEQALELAETIDDRELASVIVGNLGIVYGMQGESDRALSYFDRQADLKNDLGDRLGASVAVGNMGVEYENQGNYTRAMECYMVQLQASTEAGDQRNASIAVGNVGLIYSQQGDYARALQCYTRQLQIALERGDLRMISFALSDIADAFKAQDQLKEAETLYTQAIALGRSLNILYDLCGYLHKKADLLARQERYAEAQALNDETLEMAAQVECQDIEFQADVLRIRLRVALGQLEPDAAVDTQAALLDTWTDPVQQAVLHYELWRMGQANYRDPAAEQYAALYHQTPNITYRTRYEDLTGQALDDMLVLPELPDVITRQQVALDDLLPRTHKFMPDDFVPDR
jgi:adenylate cyclase